MVLTVPAQEQDSLEKRLRLSSELHERGNDIEAFRILEETSRLHPGEARVHYQLGSFYRRYGRSVEALASIERAVELEPEQRAYNYALGEMLYDLGRPEEAEPWLKKATTPPEPIAEALVPLAAVYEKLVRPPDVLASLRRYVELRPDDLETRVLLGDQLAGAKRYEDAIEVWKAALSLEREPSKAVLYRIGEVLSLRRESYGDAELYLRQALAVDSEFLRARLLLALILQRRGRDDAALSELELASEAHPHSSQIHYNLAKVYQRLGRSDDAERSRALFQKLSSEEKRRAEEEARVPVAYKGAAELLQLGQMAEAEQGFLSLLELAPENAHVRAMLAKIAYSRGDLLSARRFILEAMERNRAEGEFHYLSALFEKSLGRLGEAEIRVRTSLELRPGFPDAWVLLGSILADSSRPADAVGCYLNAAALEPSNAAVQLNLAAAYRALGRTQEETEAIERYRNLSAVTRLPQR